MCLSMVRSGFRSARDSVRTDRPMRWNRASFENKLPFPTFHQRLIEILFQCCNYMPSPSLRLSSVVMFTEKRYPTRTDCEVGGFTQDYKFACNIPLQANENADKAAL